MNQLQHALCAFALFFCVFSMSAQNTSDQTIYAHNDTFTAKSPEPTLRNDNTKELRNYASVANLISASYLNPADGFIGLVFSNQIKEPNIYYKIVDNAGREVYNGSAHAAVGSTPTLYYNTTNLPSGRYRVFIENADFFLSTSFIK